MPLRFLFALILLLFLIACSAPPPAFPPNSPEAALAETFQQDSFPHIVGKQPTANGTLLFFTMEARGINGLQKPSRRIGNAYLEQQNGKWVVMLSMINTPIDPETLPDRAFIHGTNTATSARGNEVMVIQGDVIDERVFWIEARFMNGEVVRLEPVEGMFAYATPSFNGLCAIRALDGNEDVVEGHPVLEDGRCIPDPFWSVEYVPLMP